MNTMKKLINIGLIQICLLITAAAYAQDPADFSGTVLEMTRTDIGGSARIQGLGGAQTALGGDISSAYSNPAGLGFFNRSEFSFTPSFNYVNSNAEYLGTTTSDGRLNLNINNLGVVIHWGNDATESDWKGGSLGISVNRIANFQNQITYEGYASTDFIGFAESTSYVDGDGRAAFDTDFAELAYNIYLTDIFTYGSEEVVERDIYRVDSDGNYLLDENDDRVIAFTNSDFLSQQNETIESRGAMYQTSLAYGGNYNDKLYFGASLGILSLDKRVDRLYRETPYESDLNSLIVEDSYQFSGAGVNATFGFTARPTTTLILALAYTTPSYMAVEQSRQVSMTANYLYSTSIRDSQTYDIIEYEPFDYNITTPSRLRAGATYFFGKNGFITGDLEKVNYSGGKLSNPEDGIPFTDENRTIDQYESAVYNFRGGGEYRFNKFRVRAGVAYLGDPTDDSLDQSELKWSLGGGIRTKRYFADMAVINSTGRESSISPYPGEAANVTTENTAVTFSVGLFF